MVGVLVTFRYGDAFSEAAVRTIADNAQAKFKGMPGLRSKTFTVDANAKEAVNLYVWDSEPTARAFFTPELAERVGGLYGVRPTVQFLEVAAFVDNAP